VSVVDDAWVCHVPRLVFQRLARDPSIHERERVLFALMSLLYERLDRDGGEALVSTPRVERICGMHRSGVRRALGQLQASGVVECTDFQPGQTKRWRLTGDAMVASRAHMSRPPRSRPVSPPSRNGAPHPSRSEFDGDQEGGANGASPINKEQENNSLSNGEQAPHDTVPPSGEQRARIAAGLAALGRRYSMGRPPQPVYEQQPEDRDPDEPDPDEALPVATEGSK